MSNPKSPTPTATDRTRLLTDPELVSQLGKLLQTYREAPPEKREEALLTAMREIKSTAPQKAVGAAAGAGAHTCATHPCPAATSTMPPFEPDIFTVSWGHDRRRHPRTKCFVAVELKIGGRTRPSGAICPIQALAVALWRRLHPLSGAWTWKSAFGWRGARSGSKVSC